MSPTSIRRPRTALVALGSTILLLAGLLTGLPVPAAQAASESLFGTARPAGAALADDGEGLTLGTRVTARVSGTITSVRYYKAAENTGTHTAAVYSADGAFSVRARFAAADEATGASGWKTSNTPNVRVTAGSTFVVAVHMPRGRYLIDPGYTFPRDTTSLSATAGTYAYGPALAFPIGRYRTSNYFIDVAFTPDAAPTPTATPTPTPTLTPVPTPTPTPTVTEPGSGELNLPRVAWEGGNAYYSKFPLAAANKADDPSYLPVAIFYNYGDNADQVQFDYAHGITTYIQGNSIQYQNAESQAAIEKYGIKTFHPGKNQIGTNLGDEVNGNTPTQAIGLQQIQDEADRAAAGGVNEMTWTSQVVTVDYTIDQSGVWINNPNIGMNSLDFYAYSVPQCSWRDDQGRWVGSRYRDPGAVSGPVNSRGIAATPINEANCRTASTYGKMIDLQREVDAIDGALKPVWGVVEVAGIGGSKGDWNIPTGAEIKGAAMNSLIHEARGIIWFDQAPENQTGALASDCLTASAFRDARIGAGESCPAIAANVAAVGKINSQIKTLAPVLNTQSYVWDFGAGTDTMLKAKDGSAYIFAMTADGGTGSRSFKLPPALAGASKVTVVDEDRTLDVVNGSFVDNFATESSYHIYRVVLGS